MTRTPNKIDDKVSCGITLTHANLIQLAHSNNQIVGEKRDYYITLEQLERALQLTNLL